MRPRTKHAAIKCHHFQSHAQKEEIVIERLDAVEQEANSVTRSLAL